MTEVREKSGNFMRGKKWEPCMKVSLTKNLMNSHKFLSLLLLLESAIMRVINDRIYGINKTL